MPYTFSHKDISEAWTRFEQFVDMEVYPRLMAQKLGAEIQGNNPDLLTYSPARLAVMSHSHPMLAAAMLAGMSTLEVERQDAPPGRRGQIPTVLLGSEIHQDAASRMALRHGGYEFSSAYQTLMESVSPDMTPFSLYASMTKNAYFYPHTADDMPQIAVPPAMLSNRPALVSEIARQTAPIYQFSYLYEGHRNDSRIRKAHAYARRAGISDDEFNRIAEAYESTVKPEPGNYYVSTAAHEFAHAAIQPFPKIGEQTLRDYAAGRISLEDIVAPFTWMNQFLYEGQADIFSMAVSLDPMSRVRQRYYAGVMDVIASSDSGSMRNFRLGDPLKVRVINPQSVESTDSPLYRLIQRYSTSFAQRTLTGSVNTSDLFADAAAAELDDVTANSFRRYLSASSLLDSSGEISQAGVALFLRSQHGMASKIMGAVIRDYRSGVFSGLDADTEELIRFQASRLWSIGYTVGKSRPDLIGQELEVTPQGVRVASTGEELDLGRMGLPELQMTAPLDAPEMHPIQVERGFSALAVYNRAREALKSGFKLNIPGGSSAADVIQTWRDAFWRVMTE